MLAVLVVIAGAGCGQPSPAYQSAYVGPATSRISPEVEVAPEASFVDKFDRPDGGLGDGWEMLQRAYQPKVPAVDGFIMNGKYTYNGIQGIYAVRQFRGTVRSVGATGSWRKLRAGADTAIALVIAGNDNLITDMLHFVVERNQWSLTVRRNNGDFMPIVNGTFQPPLNLDQAYQFELSATEASVTLSVPGKEITKSMSTDGLLGNHAFWEEYLKPNQFPAGSVFDFDTVWAAENGQPVSPVAK